MKRININKNRRVAIAVIIATTIAVIVLAVLVAVGNNDGQPVTSSTSQANQSTDPLSPLVSDQTRPQSDPDPVGNQADQPEMIAGNTTPDEVDVTSEEDSQQPPSSPQPMHSSAHNDLVATLEGDVPIFYKYSAVENFIELSSLEAAECHRLPDLPRDPREAQAIFKAASISGELSGAMRALLAETLSIMDESKHKVFGDELDAWKMANGGYTESELNSILSELSSKHGFANNPEAEIEYTRVLLRHKALYDGLSTYCIYGSLPDFVLPD